MTTYDELQREAREAADSRFIEQKDKAYVYAILAFAQAIRDQTFR